MDRHRQFEASRLGPLALASSAQHPRHPPIGFAPLGLVPRLGSTRIAPPRIRPVPDWTCLLWSLPIWVLVSTARFPSLLACFCFHSPAIKMCRTRMLGISGARILWPSVWFPPMPPNSLHRARLPAISRSGAQLFRSMPPNSLFHCRSGAQLFWRSAIRGTALQGDQPLYAQLRSSAAPVLRLSGPRPLGAQRSSVLGRSALVGALPFQCSAAWCLQLKMPGARLLHQTVALVLGS